jgi:transcriptional regulator with XRE-family HTH domain
VKGSRSEGSRLLAKKCEAFTQAGVAARLRCSRQAVAGFVSGAKRPSPERRELAERELGIPVASWDLPPASTSPAPSAPTVATLARADETRARPRDPEAPAAPLREQDLDAARGHGGALAAAQAHLAECSAALARFGPSASPRELAALLAARAGAVRALSAAEPTWSKVFASREWKAIERAVRVALTGLDDGRLETLAQTLEEADVESSRSGAKGGRS